MTTQARSRTFRLRQVGLPLIRTRRMFLYDFVLDGFMVLLALMLATGSADVERLRQYLPAAALPLLVRPGVNVSFGLYQLAWRYARIGEIARIVLAVAAGSAVVVLAFYGLLVPLQVPGATPERGFPWAFFPIELLLILVCMVALRYTEQVRRDFRAEVGGTLQARFAGRVPTLVFGAGTSGTQVVRTIDGSPDGLGMRIVGFVDDNPAKHGLVIAGVPVLGSSEDLPDVATATSATRLLFAIPTASGDVVRRVVDQAYRLGLETRTLPSFADLVSGRLSNAAIREIRVDDLLRRAPVAIDEQAIRDAIADRTVLVTGAGGSIGSELARQVFDLDPGKLALLDRAEGALYDIERDLTLAASRDSGSSRRGGHVRAPIVAHLANVASMPAMTQILEADRPSLVLHAAAYKHVPMMERHPADAIYANIGGTLTCLRASMATGVDEFVLVSTDKAVEPSSVMGATKRLAEHAVAAMATQSGRRYAAVRFGNVLGSSGSVVPLFQKQLTEGVPLTITHPDMTRYFMTIPEAARLILEASLFGEPGDLFVLDMGEPVRILDLAHDVARLSGRDPESVPIEIIGLRPGEKIHEALYYDTEATERTRHPKVIRVRRTANTFGCPPATTLSLLDALVATAMSGDHERARTELFDTLAKLEHGQVPM